MNPLASRGGTVIVGIALALIFVFLLRGEGAAANPIEWTVWFHVVVGIAWVGLLYYFNAVQIPAVAQATAEGDPGPAAINKYVAPRALFWFRYAALLTWLSGAAALGKLGIMHEAFTFQNFTFASPNISAMGMGAWLGTIMLINVWLLIWPNQKKILGLVAASDAEKAKAKKVALLASRINTALSFPMLLGMTAYGHGLPF